jgi:hypothetical protein
MDPTHDTGTEWNLRNPRFCADDLNSLLSVSPWAGHRDFAYDLTAYLKPKRIVELGTHYGCSFFTFLQASKDLDIQSEIIAIDTWKGEEHSGAYGEEVLELVRLTVETYYKSQNYKLLRKTFDEALPDIEDCSVDILHIDGFHSYDAVRHDYVTWIDKVDDDGIVLFHDIDPTCGYGSSQYWLELKTRHAHFEFPDHSYGLGILFPKNQGLYERLKILLNEAVFGFYRYRAQYRISKRQIDDMEIQLHERWSVMQKMEEMIRDRDSAIKDQSKMLEERWLIMQKMEEMIRDRDEIIAKQSKMLNMETSEQPKS